MVLRFHFLTVIMKLETQQRKLGSRTGSLVWLELFVGESGLVREALES
jgi:hypothetical protein